MDVAVNYWAVLVAGLSAMVIGFIWYSLPVFGRTWMGLISKSEADLNKGNLGAKYFGTFVLALLTAYIMAHFVFYTGAETWMRGLSTGFWAWLGFVATSFATTYIFEGRSNKLYWINSLYQLAVLLVMGAIIASWR